MSYADYQASRDGGNPIQLFLFHYGTEPGEHYAYTDHTEEMTVDHGGAIGEIIYSPVPISRGSIESNGTLDRATLKVSTDIGTGVAELFRVYPPPYVVALTIFEGHLDDPDEEYLVTWAGRVIAAQRKGSQLEMSCEPVSTSLERPGPRAAYGYGCRHVLYGPQCQANKAAATVSTTVAAIDGATIDLAPGWEGAFDPAKFLRGMVEWAAPGGSTDRRMIIRVDGDTLSLTGLPTGLAVSDPIDVVLGCNHKAYIEDGGDCEGLHDNILNYGGERWIPTQNPIGKFNNYY